MLAARWVRSQKGRKDYERKLKKPKKSLWRSTGGAAFGGCFSQNRAATLSSRIVVSKDVAVYLLEARIYFPEGKCTSREDYFGH